MFGIGMPEMFLILAVALIVIGPKKLPDLAKSLGRAIGEFKNAASELKESMEIDTELKEVKEALDDMNEDMKNAIDVTPKPENKPLDASSGKDTYGSPGKDEPVNGDIDVTPKPENKSLDASSGKDADGSPDKDTDAKEAPDKAKDNIGKSADMPGTTSDTHQKSEGLKEK